MGIARYFLNSAINYFVLKKFNLFNFFLLTVAAEVDITFGGIYLGVWLVEAKQSLSNPLIIEGCTWAAGRFKFFSASDKKKLQPNADIYGERAEVDGLIELKFKPEADTMKMFVHHVREQGSYRLVPVTVADPRTATIADLKQEIKGSWGSSISCLLKGGQVLQEEETIRYSLLPYVKCARSDQLR